MTKNIIKIIEKYFQKFPEDKEKLLVFKKQIGEEKDLFDRKNFIGHIVVNALIINKDRVLTIFHNKLKMYIQPGGHVDNTDNSVLDATIREVEEETGLKDIILENWHEESGIPIFIESHLIPKNNTKNEDEHYHHDFMYIFSTNSANINLQLEEVSDFEWIKIDKILKENPESFIGKSLERMFDFGIIQ